ncbi:branched-chain amino acid ABC transporter permease [Bradyrhizobium neotropicale]|uniref:branched-chain amino acid ABC transporter permease n=1 Tax=Bradyrhizobium neotropicale TaxID=1497615 RepID=UPI001AD79919|nr:branched-chain amino acid ABC transporter permease [Bradyrhizobium neotropicale]MBO4227908.1 branched-chain amino acid ABC transporter permease [Bradyrhizobium neotropicale]
MAIRTPLLIAAAILVIGGLFAMVLPEYYLRLLNLSAIAAVAVIGLNFAFGYAGLISLGHAAFVGMGSYRLAILTTTCGWSPWLAAPAAIVATAVLAALIGYPLLRLRGHYLALATLGLNVSFYIVTSNWIALTGGTNGIARIPELTIGPLAFSGEHRFLCLALVVLAAVAVASAMLHASRHGREMMAVRDDEIASEMIGIDTTRVKITAFVLSALCAAIAGCLFALHVRFVSPEDFSYAHSITYLAMLIVGGEGTIIGAILGAVLLTFLPEWLRFLGTAYLFFFGVLMLCILVFLPTGLVGLGRRLRRRPRKTASSATIRASEATP